MSKVWRMLRYARRESKRSLYGHKLGAIICKGAIVRSRGYNQIRYTSTGQCYSAFEESLHAERHACSQLPKDELIGCDIYLWREDKLGRPALSKPCIMCQDMLKELGLKRVIFSIPVFPYYEVYRL